MKEAAAGAIALLATPCWAWSDTSGKELANIRKIAFTYASCVVKRHHDLARDAIIALADNPSIRRSFPQIVDSDCLQLAAGSGVDMRFPSDSYSFSLADALVNADLSRQEDVSFSDRLLLAQVALISPEEQVERSAKIKGARQRKEAIKGFAAKNSSAWLSRYGECVVRRDPMNARFWLLTPPSTPEETSRIKALQPAFNSCLDRNSLTFDRVTMRGTVAINYYRLAKATVVSGARSNP